MTTASRAGAGRGLTSAAGWSGRPRWLGWSVVVAGYLGLGVERLPGEPGEPAVVAKEVVAAEGYEVRLVAAPPLVRYPMLAAFDDRGRLFVAESSGGGLYDELRDQTRRCEVRVLEDRTGDGVFDHMEVFADGLAFPMGLAWRDGELFVADPPHVVALSDTTGDGRADRRRLVLGDFGHQTNGSLHGLKFGPDGWLYMTMGMPDGFDLKIDGRTVASGDNGALIRCLPDGSAVEVVCRGFENLMEIAFMPDGAIIGTNNWHQEPANGLRDALLHLVPGGIYPRHPPTGVPFLPSTGEPLPAITVLPPVAISGLARWRHPGRQLAGEQWLVSAQFNTRQLVRHRLRPHLSSFTSRDEVLAGSDSPYFKPSDVLEDGDGSLLLVDTGLWYIQHCVTASERLVAGGIYRLDRAGGEPVEDAWGAAVDWSGQTVAQLVEQALQAGPGRADRGRNELRRRPVTEVWPALAAAATDERHPPTARAVAVRMLGLAARVATAEGSQEADGGMEALTGLLGSAAPEVVAAAARALGDAGGGSAALATALGSGQPPGAMLAIAEGLARSGDDAALPALEQALDSTDPADRMLEHALIHAIGQLADGPRLRAALESPSPRVQRAALLLLAQPPHELLAPEDVIGLLAHEDQRLRDTARGLLVERSDWEVSGLGLVREALQAGFGDDLAGEGRLTGLLDAFHREPAVSNLVAEVIGSEAGQDAADGARRVVLDWWAGSVARVEPGAGWRGALAGLLEGTGAGDEELSAAIRLAAALPDWDAGPVLWRLVEDRRRGEDVRLEALAAVAMLDSREAVADVEDTALALVLGALAEGQPAPRRLAAATAAVGMLDGETARRRVVALTGADPLVWPMVWQAWHEDRREPVSLALLAAAEGLAADGLWSPSGESLARLEDGASAAVGAAAVGLRQLVERREREQRAGLERWQDYWSGGDADRGRQVFFGPRAACSACHQVSGQGGRGGPDLTTLAAVRAREEIIEGIVLPSAAFAQGYETYLVTLADGQTRLGTIGRHHGGEHRPWQPGDGPLVLRDAAGQEHRFAAGRVASLERLPVSLMPAGLLKNLDEQEVRDLLAYLAGLR